MDQLSLYESLSEAGFKVLEFSDNPGLFGSWFVSVERQHKFFRLVFDGRPEGLNNALVEFGRFQEIRNNVKRCLPGAGGEFVRLSLDGPPKGLYKRRLPPGNRFPDQSVSDGNRFQNTLDEGGWMNAYVSPKVSISLGFSSRLEPGGYAERDCGVLGSRLK